MAGSGPTRKPSVRPSSSTRGNSPHGVDVQHVYRANDAPVHRSPGTCGNSPQGMHRLAQGQRATASATLGQGHTPPSFPRRGYIKLAQGQRAKRAPPWVTGPSPPVVSPKGIHTQRYRPTTGRDRSGITIRPTPRRTTRTALSELLWIHLPVIARSGPLWGYGGTEEPPSVAYMPLVEAHTGATRQSHLSQHPLSPKSSSSHR